MQANGIRPLLLVFVLVAFVCLGILSVTYGQNKFVKILPEKDPVGASVEAVGENEKVQQLSSCVSTDTLKRYYGGDVTKYEAEKRQNTACSIGSLSNTNLERQISDLETAIVEIDKRMSTLNLAQKYLLKFNSKNLNGFKLSAIPAGEETERKYPMPKGAAEMCVRDTVAKSGTTATVGTENYEIMNIYDSLPENEKNVLGTFRANNIAIRNALNRITLTKWTFIKSSVSAKARSIVEEQSQLMGTTMALLEKNQQLAAKYFIPITPEDLMQNYKDFYVNRNFVTTELSWVDGKRDTTDMTKLPGSIIKAIKQHVQAPIPSETTHMRITVDNDSTTGWLPEADIYRQIQDSINSHKADYYRMKEVYTGLVKNLKSQQEVLKSHNYNCN